VAALLLGLALATRSPLLDVDRIVVTGTERTPVAVVLETSGIKPGDPMTDIDVAAATTRIERLPWVADATVRRRWPARVTVAVTERVPAATLPAPGGGWALVDGVGRVLEHGPEQPPGLPVLAGLPPAGAPGEAVADDAGNAVAVAAALPKSLVERVATIEAGEGTLRMTLRPHGAVELGGLDLLEQKLLAVLAVLEEVAPDEFDNLDVRVPSAPVLTPRA